MEFYDLHDFGDSHMDFYDFYDFHDSLCEY